MKQPIRGACYVNGMRYFDRGRAVVFPGTPSEVLGFRTALNPRRPR